VGAEVSARDAIVRSCAELSYFEISSEDVKMIREVSGKVLARRGEIIGSILDALFRDAEAARLLHGCGLDRETMRVRLERWMDLMFLGGYDVEHCIKLSKAGLLYAKAGVPLTFILTRIFPICTQEVLKHFSSDDPHIVPILKSVIWHMMVIVLGYEFVRQRAFEKVLGVRDEVYERLKAIALRELAKELGWRLE
jgi:hypothetical protein